MTIPQIAQSEIDPRPIAGPFSQYLNAQETSLLIALMRSACTKPMTILEFGCNSGATANNIINNLPVTRYIGVDVPHGHRTALECQQSEVRVHPGCRAAHHHEFWLLLRPGGSVTLTPQDLEGCSAIFIDGDHSRDAVLHDSRLARALIQSPGIIIWHDAGNPSVEVDAALDILRSEGWPPIFQVENSWLAFARF